jgi:hypothetical protein
MHTNRYLPIAISISIAFSASSVPALAQYAGAFAAQRDALIKEQQAADEAKATEAAAAAKDDGGEKKAQADSSDSAKATDTKTDSKPADATTSGDEKKTDATADKKDDTAATGEKKDDPLAVDGEKKADGEDGKTDEEKEKEKEDEKKVAEEEQKKQDDAEKAAKASGYTPVKAAIFDINNGHPEDAIAKLSPLVAKNAKDVQAHYILATAYVLARKYEQAAEQYKTVLKLVPADSKIAARATEGLRKINH